MSTDPTALLLATVHGEGASSVVLLGTLRGAPAVEGKMRATFAHLDLRATKTLVSRPAHSWPVVLAVSTTAGALSVR